jgi:DNA-binding CsgD family transcriptional regulator
MSEGYQALTEKEKQALRLIVRGHDAKSAARHLGLSVHTVNERLRDARRKMAVSSSREAARRLLDAEGGSPDFLMDKQLGDADAVTRMRQDAAPDDGRAVKYRSAWAIRGVLVMSLFLATLALGSLSQVTTPPGAERQTVHDDAAGAPIVAETEAARSARTWLALVDEKRWNESWSATGQAFRKLNTSKTWASASEEVRTPLGAVISRTLSSQENIPAPPHG